MKTIIVDICDKELEDAFLALIFTRAKETNFNVSMYNNDNVGIITTCANFNDLPTSIIPTELPAELPAEQPEDSISLDVGVASEPVPSTPVELNVSIPTLTPVDEPISVDPVADISNVPEPSVNAVPSPIDGTCVIYSFSSTCVIPYSSDFSLPCSILEVPRFTTGPEFVDIVYCGFELKYPLLTGEVLSPEEKIQNPRILIVVQRDNDPNTVLELAVELKLSADGKERMIFNSFEISYD